MKNNANKILIGFLLTAFSYNVLAEVTTLSIVTDTSWKSLDFENEGWTSENYDDSWWTSVIDADWASIESAEMIWYPGGKIKPEIVYYRNVFEIDGTDILNGKLFTTTHSSGGIVYLFINSNPIPKIMCEGIYDPAEIDITSYLKPGKNIIAAKVEVPPENAHAWALICTTRYNKLAPGQPIN
jgi:hypothetical protein